MTIRLYFAFFILYICENDQSVIFMKKEKFENVQRTYNYTPRSIFTNQLSNIAFGIGMVIVPLIWSFGLRIRRLQIISPTVFSTILIIGGILLLLYTFSNMRKVRTLIAQGGSIKVDGKRVTYPTFKKGNIEYKSLMITDIEYIKDDDEEHQFKISLPDQYVIIECKYFDTEENFDDFRNLLE